jgi:uncharacterized protein YxeA
MKKHILGFVIFSLIIGSAVFVSAMFYKRAVKKEYVYEVSERSCWREVKRETKNNPAPVKIVQAVFNSKTKQFDVDFSTLPTQNVEVYLIYKKQNDMDNWEAGYKMESLTLMSFPNYKTTQSLILPWIKDLKSTDSMYVSIKSSNEKDSFDSKVPVLIIPEK